jgi:hypothetical protein
VQELKENEMRVYEVTPITKKRMVVAVTVFVEVSAVTVILMGPIPRTIIFKFTGIPTPISWMTVFVFGKTNPVIVIVH